MIDRSKELYRLKLTFKNDLKPGTLQLMAIPDEVNMEDLPTILKGENVDLDNENLFILRHREVRELMEDENIPQALKDEIQATYDEVKEMGEENKKEALKFLDELNNLTDDDNFEQFLIKKMIEVTLSKNKEDFKITDETFESAQMLHHFASVVNLPSFHNSLMLATVLNFRKLSEGKKSSQQSTGTKSFLERSSGGEYFSEIENCALDCLRDLLFKFKDDSSLREYVQGFEDLMVLLAMMTTKALQIQKFIDMAFEATHEDSEESDQESDETSETTKADFFKMDSNQVS